MFALSIAWLWAATAHAEPRPVLSLRDVQLDPCGVLRGRIDSRKSLLPRRVSLILDASKEETFTVTVPAGEDHVEFQRLIDTRYGKISARWWFIDVEPVNYSIDSHLEPQKKLDISVPDAPPLGEVDPLVVRLAVSCVPEMLSLKIVSDSPQMTLWDTAPGDPHTTIPLDALAVGRHTLTATLSIEDVPLETQTFPLVIAPPCMDTDGDGHMSCRGGDCDDNDPEVHPGASDPTRNGRDEDCDGRDGPDSDGDGVIGVESGGTDCDDRNAGVFPGAVRFPDQDGDGIPGVRQIDYNCDGIPEVFEGLLDCNDHDPTIPRTEEPVPTGIDEDCDGLVDEGTVAFDDDGDGLSEMAGDCDDTDAAIHPGATERPNCRDDDCDTHIDEGIRRPQQDDSYEPNDSTPAELAGAVRMSGIFGGYHPTYERLHAVTRDSSDIERFTLYAHDGTLDSFHVTVQLREMGDTLGYRVSIRGPSGRVTREIRERGALVSIGGRPGNTDTGTYLIEVVPLPGLEALDYCPLLLEVSSG